MRKPSPFKAGDKVKKIQFPNGLVYAIVLEVRDEWPTLGPKDSYQAIHTKEIKSGRETIMAWLGWEKA